MTGAIGWVDAEPVRRDVLDARLAALYAAPHAGALPAPDSREGRQLRRWSAHVIFTELVCAHRAAELGVHSQDIAALDPLAAVQLGSITAAAWRSEPAVSALYLANVRQQQPAQSVAAPQRWRLRLATAPTLDMLHDAPPVPIGWTLLDDLPPAIASAARVTPRGATAGPLRSRHGWHVVFVDDVAMAEPGRPDRPDTARLREFTRLLDVWRARAVRPAAGFEHPGDPRQPDNTHRH